MKIIIILITLSLTGCYNINSDSCKVDVCQPILDSHPSYAEIYADKNKILLANNLSSEDIWKKLETLDPLLKHNIKFNNFEAEYLLTMHSAQYTKFFITLRYGKKYQLEEIYFDIFGNPNPKDLLTLSHLLSIFDDEKKNYQYTVANLVSSMNKSNEDKLNKIFITKKVKIKQLNIYAFKPVNQNITRFIIYKTK